MCRIVNFPVTILSNITFLTSTSVTRMFQEEQSSALSISTAREMKSIELSSKISDFTPLRPPLIVLPRSLLMQNATCV